jgi:hypothetical protein
MSMVREGDRDIHLVVADPKVGGSMIVEFPHPDCTTGASEHARILMTAARKALADACVANRRERWPPCPERPRSPGSPSSTLSMARAGWPRMGLSSIR